MSAPRGIPPKSTKRSRQMMMTKAKANQTGISTTAKAIGAVAKLVPGGQVIGQVADVIGDVVGGRGQSPPQTPISYAPRGQSPPQTPILKREPLTLHAIIINKSVPLDEAKKKAKEISRLRRKLFMRETTDSYRFRIIPKTRFKNFISKPISDTITLVLGNLKDDDSFRGGASRKRPTSALGERIKAIGRIADPSQREQAISDETARQEQENIISQERQAQKNIEDEDPTGVGRFSRNVLRPIGDVGIDLATKIPVVGEFLKPLKQIKDVAYGVTGGRRTGRERPTPPIPADIQEAIRQFIIDRFMSVFQLTEQQLNTFPIEILQRVVATGTVIPLDYATPAINGIYEDAYAYAVGTLGLDTNPKQFSYIFRPFMGSVYSDLVRPIAEYAENQIQENQFEINQFIQGVALPALRPFYMTAGAQIASINADGRPFSTRDIFYLLFALNEDARQAYLHYTRGIPLRISPDDIGLRLSAENVLTNNIMAEIYDRFNPEFPRLEWNPEGRGEDEFIYDAPSEGTRSPSDIDLTDIPDDGVINTFTGEYPMGRARSDAITGDEEDEDQAQAQAQAQDEDEGGKDEEPDDDEDTKDEEQQ